MSRDDPATRKNYFIFGKKMLRGPGRDQTWGRGRGERGG